MRRIYLGGLALGLGMFASPAAGQDARTAPQQRAARLGRPVAASDAPAPAPVDTGVRPAGLVTPRSGEVPVPSAMPVGGRPTSTPLGSAPVGTPTMSAPQPAGRVIGGPSVVEDRGGVPSPTPTPTLGTLTYPTALPNGATVVPSVGPEYGSPLPGYEGPVTIGGDCGLAVGDPGIPVMGDAVGRVAGPGRWWATGEYLMWWTQSTSVPTLVTTSSPQFNGILGQGNTTPLVTGSFGQTFHSGGRFGVGRWFGAEQIRGVEARMFFLGQAASTATYTTAMVPFLARPFNNVNPNTPFFGPDSEVVADSTRATGGVQVHLENQLWGAELNYRRNLWGGDPCNPCSPHRLDALVGYRYVNFSEKLTVTENFTTLPGAALPVPFASGVVTDMFRTSNEFHGGQIGLAGSTQRGRWSLDGRAAIAFGTLNRTLYIDGSQNLLMANGMPVTAQGGLLAIPGANIGKYNDSVFSVVPEAGLNIGYQLTSRMKLFVGYNFLYMTNVLRPAGAIDTNLDAARIPNFLATPAAPVPGTPRPAPQFNASGFFVQGISFGVQFNW